MLAEIEQGERKWEHNTTHCTFGLLTAMRIMELGGEYLSA